MNSRKKLKLEREAQLRPARNEKPNGCQFWVKKKRRFCKMEAKKGLEFCGEHGTEEKVEKLEDNRILCPLDKTHTVAASKLEKHLKVCNKRVPENLPAFVKPKINFLDKSEAPTPTFRLRDVPKDEIDSVIKVVEEIYSKFIADKIKSEIRSHEIFNDELKRPDLGEDSLRHLRQASSMFGILKERNFIKSETCFADLGAGRGSVSFWLAKMIENDKLEKSKVLVIDRASHRFKRDNKVDDRSLIERIRVDIGDLDLKGGNFGECKTIIGISKHLCGGATDLALKCLINANSGPIKSSGILICVCCHHQITHNTFVGRDWLHSNGVDQRMFEIIIKMVSWYICGDGRSREERKEGLIEDHERREEMAELGWKCKRILDYARVEFLRSQGYEAELSFYIDKSQTLENVCIVARYLEKNCEDSK